jgi:hypothetical protein
MRLTTGLTLTLVVAVWTIISFAFAIYMFQYQAKTYVKEVLEHDIIIQKESL